MVTSPDELAGQSASSHKPVVQPPYECYSELADGLSTNTVYRGKGTPLLRDTLAVFLLKFAPPLSACKLWVGQAILRCLALFAVLALFSLI